MTQQCNSDTDVINTDIQTRCIQKYGIDVYNRWIKNAKYSIKNLPLSNEEIINKLSVGDTVKASIMDFGLFENNVMIARLSLADGCYSKQFYLINNIDIPMVYELSNYTKLVSNLCTMPNDLAVKCIIAVINYTINVNSGIIRDEPYYSVYSIDQDPVPIQLSVDFNDTIATISVTNLNNNDTTNVIQLTSVPEIIDLRKHYMTFKHSNNNEYYNVEVNIIDNPIIKNETNIIPDVFILQAINNHYNLSIDQS